MKSANEAGTGGGGGDIIDVANMSFTLTDEDSASATNDRSNTNGIKALMLKEESV